MNGAVIKLTGKTIAVLACLREFVNLFVHQLESAGSR
jgi:hypothetical protein